MVAFPSTEWAVQFKTALNANAVYKEAAAAWEGDLMFEVLPNAQTMEGPGIYLDLFHGECRDARFVTDPTTVNPEFVLRATRENWEKLMHRELDPIKAFLGGTIKMSGNPAKLMRFIGAAKELLDTAAGIPTDG
jgi:putative sterol carrier protein